ncbi:hypothetical protein D3C74_316770 [compost metagenome]
MEKEELDRSGIDAGLTPEQQDLFLNVYDRHVKAMGIEMRQRLGRIKDVKWNEQQDCLIVTYKSGDWWHYCKDGTWY